MATPTHHDPATQAVTTARVTGWDRAAITLLGGAGCALSYDALQQMATAIHIRGVLTYLFPLVIDGFIAYGVRAILVLRTAPFAARLYTWALFAAATIASLCANALHAVRLNNRAPADGLHLGDATVGVLSTLAPLALAGAVHLHILIARHTQSTPRPEPVAPSAWTERASDHGRFEAERDGRDPEADETPVVTDTEADQEEVPPAQSVRIGRPPSADLDDLIGLARPLFEADGKPTREAVRSHLKAAGHRIGQERLTQVMTTLRTETSQADGTAPGG